MAEICKCIMHILMEFWRENSIRNERNKVMLQNEIRIFTPKMTKSAKALSIFGANIQNEIF